MSQVSNSYVQMELTQLDIANSVFIETEFLYKIPISQPWLEMFVEKIFNKPISAYFSVSLYILAAEGFFSCVLHAIECQSHMMRFPSDLFINSSWKTLRHWAYKERE